MCGVTVSSSARSKYSGKKRTSRRKDKPEKRRFPLQQVALQSFRVDDGMHNAAKSATSTSGRSHFPAPFGCHCSESARDLCKEVEQYRKDTVVAGSIGPVRPSGPFFRLPLRKYAYVSYLKKLPTSYTISFRFHILQMSLWVRSVRYLTTDSSILSCGGTVNVKKKHRKIELFIFLRDSLLNSWATFCSGFSLSNILWVIKVMLHVFQGIKSEIRSSATGRNGALSEIWLS